jgi:RNA polymerase sigma-70 factor (ECF subfamily)
MEDAALVARTARGEVAAFTALFDRHAGAVNGLAARFCGRSLAEDVTQDVFLVLWRNAGRFDPDRNSVRGWLLTITRNRSLDVLRHSAERLRADLDVDGLERRSADANVEDEAFGGEDRRRVRRTLARLPEAQRTCLALGYFGGLSQVEIADSLGIPLGTVKARTRLGLTRMARAVPQPA